MYNEKKIGRITGVLYLIVIFCAGFAQGVARESVIIAGDAIATANNILANSALFEWGLVTDLIAFSTDIAISVLLYILLKSVNKPLALTMACFRLIAHPGVATANLLNHAAALKVLESDGLASQFSQVQLSELSLFFLEAHHLGYILAGVAFGIHCYLLGYLIIKSGHFPTLLGILIIGTSFGYLIESFGFILYPEHKVLFGWIVGISAAVGEVTLCMWLMIKGSKA
ncbi:DUF4386 domain-containing protein [Gracilimonas sp. BCB1]|uniref:DUF4386 domain-containing protein n=1 Tax=Gracilimonas sp. BCB1 TaxID=3152362 RepID=UPI0032D8C66A